MGINYFDTARVYQGGNNERMVGAALKKGADPRSSSPARHTHDQKSAFTDLDASLKELQTDHLDVWLPALAHQDAREVTDELLEAQRIAKKDGRVRFAGVSFHGGHADMIPAMLKLNHFDVFLMSYNFTMDPSVDPLIAPAHQAGVGTSHHEGLSRAESSPLSVPTRSPRRSSR